MGKDTAHPRYLVANADEMEPGTFKDRCLMEGDPHQLIEGIILASYATDVDIAYIFIRGEYRTSAQRLSKAIAEAYDKHYLGKGILGSDYSLEMYVHLSAGRYMCGEETGLLNALEGKRANPRSKPPFPGGCRAVRASLRSSTTSKPYVMFLTSSTRRELVPETESHRGRRHQNLWCEWKSEASRIVGTSDGHSAARNPGGARRRNARRLEVSRPVAGRRIHGLSGGTSTSTFPWISPRCKKSGADWEPGP